MSAALLFALYSIVLPFLLHAGSAAASSPPVVVLAVGAPGEPEYGTNFLRQAEQWSEAARRGGARLVTIGTDPADPTNDLPRLKQALESESKDGDAALWLVLIGHGTFDGKEARFNLRGPDISATELSAWLQPISRPLVVINTASASSPFLQKLSRTNRIVITATRSGYEQNLTRFGQFLAEALLDPISDLDADAQVSLFEAFLSASQRVADYYKNEGRLVTEHALLDDNGDGLGTPADWFHGLRLVKKPKQGQAPDSVRTHQFHLVPSAAEQQLKPAVRIRRDELERKIANLRELKTTLPEDTYYGRLETLLRELAELYREAGPPNPSQ